MKKYLFFGLNFTLCVLSCNFLNGCQDKKPYKESRLAMGTFIEVVSSDKRAPEIAFLEIKRLENLLSKYEPESDVYRLNLAGCLKVSPETFFLIKRSKELREATNGAFDITVAPMVDLWGFTDRQFKVPSAKEIRNTLKLVGADKIVLHESDNVVEFKLQGMKIDLGAIAKGYALDKIIEKLKKNGINNCLINLGGQISCLGDNSGSPWEVVIRNHRSQAAIEVLEIKNSSVATSGDYEQYFRENNRNYGHIFDPRTGYPADTGIESVTVIAPSGLTADALSTAAFVLGQEQAGILEDKFPGVRIKYVKKNAAHNR